MFDFPNSPGSGQIFTAPNGVQYTWNGTVWLQGTPAGALKTARRPNLVVNPAMQVSYENGNTAGTVSGYYPADQWYLSGVLAGACQRLQTVITPDGSPNTISLWVTTAKPTLAAGDYEQMVSRLEGLNTAVLQWGTARAIPAVLRFSASCATTGTYTVAVSNTDASQSWLAGFNVTATLQTFVLPVPPNTAGTWATDNTPGVTLHFSYAVGSTYVGVAGWQAANKLAVPAQANGAAVTGTGLIIGDVGFYADPDNTGIPPTWETPDYATEFNKCLRYWRTVAVSQASYGAASGDVQVSAPLIPLMRAVPASAVIGTGTSSNIAGANMYPSGNRYNFQIQPSTVGNMGWYNYTYSFNARM